MEKVVKDSVYIVNMDYEQILAGKKIPFQGKKKSEFEYIFFFIEDVDKVLYSQKSYSIEYIEHIKRYKKNIPQYTNKKTKYPVNWWGTLDIKNIELEKNLNSKIVSTKIAKELKLCPDSVRVVTTQSELDNYIAEFPQYLKFVLKSEFGFSGSSIEILNREDYYSLNTRKAISPYLNRVLDLGLTFDLIKGTCFFVKNIINKNGSFVGGSYIGSVDDLVIKYPFVDKNELLIKIDVMKKYFLELGVKSLIEVDMFFYREDNLIRPYYMVEINYRKTMGLMLKSLYNLFPKSYNLWILIPRRYFVKEFYAKEVFEEFLEVVHTSPKSSYFQTLYFHSESKDVYLRKIVSFKTRFLNDLGMKFFKDIENDLFAPF